MGLTKNKTQLKIWGKTQRESARRPKSDWGKIHGVEIPPVAKSRGLNSNALAHAECPMLTYGRSTCAPITFLFVDKSSPIFCVPFTACRYLYAFQRYSRSKSKVCLHRTNFWTFFCPPKF